MNHIGSFEAKTHLAKLLDLVQKGEHFIITRHGVPVAILAPIREDNHDVDITVQAIRTFRRGIRLQGTELREIIEEGRC